MRENIAGVSLLRALRAACFAWMIAFVNPVFSEGRDLKVEVLHNQASCPWDDSLKCAKVQIHAGDGDKAFRVTIDDNAVFLYSPDVEVQVQQGLKWVEHAPVLATYDSPSASLILHKGATWAFFVEINAAAKSSKRREFRVTVQDMAGKRYLSAPFWLPDQGGRRN